MADMERLQERLYEKLHRRPAGIDRMDRLWEAAVLLPIVRTEEGPAVLFEVRAKTLKRQPGEICFPEVSTNVRTIAFSTLPFLKPARSLACKKVTSKSAVSLILS